MNRSALRAHLSLAGPLYLDAHLKPVNRAFAREGSVESARRRLALNMTWGSAGRASEVAGVTWDSIEWDAEFGAAYVEIVQMKVAKIKNIMFVAGADRHSDFFLALGDYLALRQPKPSRDDEPDWLIPELNETKSPGTTITNYLKALRPEGGAVGYKEYAVPGLPETVCAGGIRPGASNTLAKFMPGELIVQLTGHGLEGSSAVYNYIDADRALAIPGALVLAGWSALPWSQLGEGPQPPTLEALRDAGVDLDDFERAIDHIFNIDSAVPAVLKPGGKLRPLLRTALASMIMYTRRSARLLARCAPSSARCSRCLTRRACSSGAA